MIFQDKSYLRLLEMLHDLLMSSKKPSRSFLSIPPEEKIIRGHFMPTLSSNHIEESFCITFSTHSVGIITLGWVF